MLYDQGQTNNDFEEKHKSIMLNMAKYFAIPKLTRNMRNSDNINKVFQGVKEMDSYYETVQIECYIIRMEYHVIILYFESISFFVDVKLWLINILGKNKRRDGQNCNEWV